MILLILQAIKANADQAGASIYELDYEQLIEVNGLTQAEYRELNQLRLKLGEVAVQSRTLLEAIKYRKDQD